MHLELILVCCFCCSLSLARSYLENIREEGFSSGEIGDFSSGESEPEYIFTVANVSRNETELRNCTSCVKGLGRSKRCFGECVACELGKTFNDGNVDGLCMPCTVCGKINKSTKSVCTTESDSVCDGTSSQTETFLPQNTGETLVVWKTTTPATATSEVPYTDSCEPKIVLGLTLVLLFLVICVSVFLVFMMVRRRKKKVRECQETYIRINYDNL